MLPAAYNVKILYANMFILSTQCRDVDAYVEGTDNTNEENLFFDFLFRRQDGCKETNNREC